MKTKGNSFLKVASTFIIAIAFFAPLFSVAAESAASPTKQSYYLVSLTWDSEKNTVTVNKDEKTGKPSVSITDKNITNDTGTGSQFYVFIVNPALKYAIFQKTNSTKYFLGRWNLPGSQKTGEIKVTIPFIAGSSKIYFVDSKTNKYAASLDVSELSRKVVAEVPKKAVAQTQIQPTTGARTYIISGHSAAYWWTVRFIVLVVLSGGIYLIYRWRKKKKALRDSSAISNQMKK